MSETAEIITIVVAIVGGFVGVNIYFDFLKRSRR